MKKYILLFFLGLAVNLNAQNIVLPLPLVIQQQSKWCGVASSLSVLRYYGYWGPLQCSIMEYIRTIHPAIYGFTDCCVNDSVDCNNKGLDFFGGVGSGSIGDVLEHFGPVYTAELPTTQLINEIRMNLEMKRPIIVQLEDFFGTKGHAVVICGMNGDSVKYMDPSDDPREGGFRHMHYNDFVNDGLVKWTNTLTMVTNPPDGLGCSNCELDPGEERIDCGGPNCPPCVDLPEEKIIDGTIPSEVMALKKITARGSARVSPGDTVIFITTDTGTIVLSHGFRAQAGSEFRTYMTDLSGFTRACGKICYCHYIYPKLSRKYDYLNLYALLSAVRIEYGIYDKAGNFIYGNEFDISDNGGFRLWDLETGALDNTGRVVYDIYYTVHFCNGVKSNYKWRFIVRTLKVNHTPLNEEPEETENFDPNQSSGYAPLNIQDELSAPTLSVIPNPNAGSFRLETNIPLSDIATLKVTNMLGTTIYETQHLSSYTIQLPAVAAGQHLVVVVLKDGRIITEKMIIQR